MNSLRLESFPRNPWAVPLLYCTSPPKMWKLSGSVHWMQAPRCCSLCRTNSGATATGNSAIHSDTVGDSPSTFEMSLRRKLHASPRQSLAAGDPNVYSYFACQPHGRVVE